MKQILFATILPFLCVDSMPAQDNLSRGAITVGAMDAKSASGCVNIAAYLSDAAICACFQHDDLIAAVLTEINEVRVEDADLTYRNGRLYLSKLKPGTAVRVYNTAGRLLYNGAFTDLPLNNGIYLLKVGNGKVVKLVIR